MAGAAIRPLPVGSGAAAVHRAGWLVADPDTVLRDGYLVTAGGRVQALGSGRCPDQGPVTDHGPGVLMPALTNAHTHLELTALAGAVTTGGGFLDWVRQLVTERGAASAGTLTDGAEQGVSQLQADGCGLVGEVSTLGLSWSALSRSPMAGVWFREALGEADVPALPEAPVDTATRVAASLAGHAPHTTAPALLTALKSAARRRRQPFAIHLAESAEETDFLTSGRGAWADFMRQRGIPFDSWPLNGRGPVAYCRDLGLLDGDTLAVHLLQAQKGDWRLLAECGAKVCLCPRSNRLLHGRLPDVAAMLAAGLRPALGTDSLASTPSLSIFDEMRYVADNYTEIAPRQILAMGTVNGAAALGCGERYGRLLPGASAGLVYVDIQAAAEKPLLEAIVAAGEPLSTAATEEAS